jgi:glycosyltransferase involved in cell wall biosynthesis
MQIALISPYHGGSHAAWANGYRRSSRHALAAFTLPGRFWKWRMHGGAVTLARRFLAAEAQLDLLLATDMLDLTTFLALTRARTSHLPAALYMHENQLTYPLPADKQTGPMRRQLGERDQHYAFVNFASMLAADRVFFNSRFHRDSFFAALPNFLKHFPEYNELNSIELLQRRSEVLPVGVDLRRLGRAEAQPAGESERPSLILWNQRWEYDKNPAAFFRALYQLADEGLAFRLALCGEQFGKRPSVFDEAIARLGTRVVHVGYADEATYARLLWEAAVTVSTAHHEFFGISILEAIYCRTFPILPRRLSYPELIPERRHLDCLYENEAGLLERLRRALLQPEAARGMAEELATAVAIYDWAEAAPRYDAALAALCVQTTKPKPG